ncbi:S-layer homology domain-containing protein [Heliorestis acidaminivorans]|nr:S-layer homology domain-containing protein [Heliorestis acidaminivorans]
MRRKVLSLLLAMLMFFGMATAATAANEEHAWVLVDTHIFPANFTAGESAIYSATVKNGTIEVKSTRGGRLDRDPPMNMHAIYTWTNPPSRIKALEKVTIKINQNVISNSAGGWAAAFRANFYMAQDGLGIHYGPRTHAEGTYPDGTPVKNMGFGTSSSPPLDSASQKSVAVDVSLQFRDKAQKVGDRQALYFNVNLGSPGSVGVRYSYEWQKIASATPAPTTPPVTTPAPVSPAPAPPVTPAPSTNHFSDLNRSHWAYDTIMEMVELGILSGYPDGTFRPNNTVTRAEFASIMVRTLELETTTPARATFTDVPTSHWAFRTVESARAYLTGYRDTRTGALTFEPNSVAVREDVAVAIVKAQGLANARANVNLLNQFSDRGQISPALREQVAIAVEYGFMQGTNQGFEPQKALTRAEACALLSRILKAGGGKEKVTM